MNLADQTYQQAIVVLKHCAKPIGFYASGLAGGYEAVWARDSMIASLGASLIGREFKTPFQKSLELLSRHQSKLGQIPNAVGSYNVDRRSDVTFNSIDSSLWYLIGHYVYAKAYQDKSLLKRFKKNIDKAFLWLSYQDPNEDGLLVQQPTMDWQDAFPHKYGRAISTQALYYAALKMYGKNKSAQRIKKVVNGKIEKYLSLYDQKRGYYLPWIWKNHNAEREEEYWFDSFSNLMAIVSDLATSKIANHILNYIEKKKINQPYPVKAIWPTIKPGDKEWHSYFKKCDARRPYHYLNAGIWPFLGGFYVAALVKTKKFKKAEEVLEKLALANKQVIKESRSKKLDWGFHEWLDGRSGKPIPHSNPYQAWSAGMYLYAYECVKRKRALYLGNL